jgi:hypothetical protein
MDWWVPKTGMEMFDALHACGLAVFQATAGEEPVTLEDEGLAYRICSTQKGAFLHPASEFLDRVLQLPSVEEIAALDQMRHPLPLAFTNVDGLLAALYTQQGIRLASLAELQQQQRHTPAASALGLRKMQTIMKRLKNWAERYTQGGATWLDHVLQDYATTPAPGPIFGPIQRANDLSLWLTLDPALGKSTRQSVSDGLIAIKSNLTMGSPRFGVFLSIVGAARFLRAQPVAGQLINYYVPLPTALTLTPETSLPTLPALIHPYPQALVAHWLAYVRPHPPLGASWQAMAYQTLSAGGARQAFSLTRGALPFECIGQIAERTSQDLIRSWYELVKAGQDQAPYEVARLCDALMHHDRASWLMHLSDYAYAVMRFPDRLRPYRDAEVQEVTQMMAGSSTPLSAVFERKEGTLRFGHALRLLGQVNHAKLEDLFDLLERVQTLEQLQPAIKQTAQACTLASAKSPFIIVPDDNDYKYLLEDVDRHGVRLIVSLLQVLAVLRYPHLATEPAKENTGLGDGTAAALQSPQGTNQSSRQGE